MKSQLVTRFAPSPTGPLHLGHAASALAAHDFARAQGGRFLLRIEDIDQSRARSAFVQGINEDLAWLGLTWETPVRVQSAHMADYAAALATLKPFLYPCFCTRADIAAASTAPHGPEGVLYPGTCRNRTDGAAKVAADAPHAWRLNVAKASAHVGALSWQDSRAGLVQADPASLGDVVLARKDVPTSYHLAVTVDDALQGITHIVRGADLFHATHIHRLLQALLGLPTPHYHHHRLILGPDGKRLAKRDASQTLAALRQRGVSPNGIRDMIALAAQTEAL
jgi:glutamyl-Q tRNA(Asp) synthetase